MPLNPFCRKRDWRQWILDLMGYPACDFAPRCLLLRLQQIRQVLEHDNVSRTFPLMAERSHRDRNIQRPVRERHLHLTRGESHAVSATQQRFEIFDNVGRVNLREGRASSDRETFLLPSIRMKYAKQRLIGMGNAKVSVEREHASRDTFQNCLHLAAA